MTTPTTGYEGRRNLKGGNGKRQRKRLGAENSRTPHLPRPRMAHNLPPDSPPRAASPDSVLSPTRTLPFPPAILPYTTTSLHKRHRLLEYNEPLHPCPPHGLPPRLKSSATRDAAEVKASSSAGVHGGSRGVIQSGEPFLELGGLYCITRWMKTPMAQTENHL